VALVVLNKKINVYKLPNFITGSEQNFVKPAANPTALKFSDG